MKKITQKKIKELLISLNADESTIELISDNVTLYNNLVTEYNKGERVNQYLLYQLNNQILKQIEAVKKLNVKLGEVEEVDDEFIKTIKSITEQQQKQKPIGFAVVNKKDDVEHR